MGGNSIITKLLALTCIAFVFLSGPLICHAILCTSPGVPPLGNACVYEGCV